MKEINGSIIHRNQMEMSGENHFFNLNHIEMEMQFLKKSKLKVFDGIFDKSVFKQTGY